MLHGAVWPQTACNLDGALAIGTEARELQTWQPPADLPHGKVHSSPFESTSYDACGSSFPQNALITGTRCSMLLLCKLPAIPCRWVRRPYRGFLKVSWRNPIVPFSGGHHCFAGLCRHLVCCCSRLRCLQCSCWSSHPAGQGRCSWRSCRRSYCLHSECMWDIHLCIYEAGSTSSCQVLCIRISDKNTLRSS